MTGLFENIQAHTIIDALPDATWVIDANGVVLAWNRAAHELTGVSADDMVGKSNYEYALPFYRDRRPILIDIAIHADPAVEADYVSFRRFGDSVEAEIFVPLLRPNNYLWGTARKLLAEDGTVVGAIESVRDITERKLSERREHSRVEILEMIDSNVDLSEILNKLALIIEEEIPGGLCSILLANHEGTRLANGAAPSLPAFYVLATDGIRIADGIGCCGTAAFRRQRVVVEDIASHRYWRGFKPVQQAGFVSCWSEPILSSSGTLLGTFAVYHSETHSPDEREISLLESAAHFASIAIDRVKFEQALRDSEQKYREVVESANSVIIRMTPDGVVTFVNEYARKLLSGDDTDIIGRPVLDTVLAGRKASGEDQIAILAEICRQPDKFPLTELEFKNTGREPILLSLSIKATMNADSTVNDILLIGQDISERKHMQDLIITAEKMVMVGGLTAGMAHELNNPLGTILQNLQNIQRRISGSLPANEEVAESVGLDLKLLNSYFDKRGISRMLEDTFKAGTRAADIISDMQKFSRKGINRHESVAVSDLIEAVIDLASCDYELKKTYNFRSITVVREYDEQIPALRICRPEMEQVLFNLLKNAAQAVADNPPERPPQLTVHTVLEGSWVTIAVGDNGSGMSEDISKRVFEPFFTTREVGAGTGLGLSVSYAIVVNNHRGSISVSSVAGEGSLFTVRLPLITEALPL